jgi:hypothetical protein
VFVQGAKSGGGVSAPIAQRIMEESLALDKPNSSGVQLASLEPAVGSFTPIEAVDYTKSGVAPSVIAQDDRETADHTDAPIQKKTEKQVAAKPDIRAKADTRGKVQGKKAAPPPTPAPQQKNFFQKLFGGGRR